MKLIVHELPSSDYLEQVMTSTSNTNVFYIRPHIYKHNNPTGTLTVQIYDSAGVTKIAESDEVTITDIGTLAYFHGYVRFSIEAFLAKDTDYRIRLVGSGDYTFNESAYCGWCNGYDLAKYPISPTPANPLSFPLDLEIWEKREI